MVSSRSLCWFSAVGGCSSGRLSLEDPCSDEDDEVELCPSELGMSSVAPVESDAVCVPAGEDKGGVGVDGDGPSSFED